MPHDCILVLLEVAAGNECVGTAWHVAYLASKDTTLGEILEWEKKQPGDHGRLMIITDITIP